MKIIDMIPRIAGLFSMGILFLMMLLTVADVFLRAVFNKPIIGATEIAEQMMVAIVFLGLGWCAQQGRQIRVDLFVTRYPPGVQRAIDLFVYCIGLILVAVICWRTFEATITVKDLNITSAYIGVPKYPFYAMAGSGWAVLFVAMAGLFLKRIKDGTKR
ncbi:MAG: TRAP transporter small permease [Deltaproteobacteria bacterium]|nr:TRAP transporter small permease [Deltaproteobacteria bacterium]